jgi:hypothetical protein
LVLTLASAQSAADAVLLESSRIAQGQEGAGEWLRRMVREQTGAVRDVALGVPLG